MGIDGFRPASVCVNEHCASMILQFPNASFSDSVLKMGVYATEGKGLTLLCNCLAKLVIGKSAIVSMIMLYRHAMCSCKSFE
jgi:hypothetical protein